MSDNTKQAIVLRINRTPAFEVVPQHAISLFDRVIEETEVEATRLHPDNVWGRVEFWKGEILSRVAAPLRGLVAVQFHEYIAATMRGGDGVEVETDDYGPVPSYGGEARAQHDAYMACCASLS
jgi:hypothetical protein